jgi:cyclophilin family peptidyl-prolyl cis-trans isomerase
VQGGGYDAAFSKRPTRAPVQNEATNGLKNTRGTVAMARTSDPHSATAQFFVNVSDNASLNHKNTSDTGWGYTVFGKVTAGMDVVARQPRDALQRHRRRRAPCPAPRTRQERARGLPRLRPALPRLRPPSLWRLRRNQAGGLLL